MRWSRKAHLWCTAKRCKNLARRWDSLEVEDGGKASERETTEEAGRVSEKDSSRDSGPGQHSGRPPAALGTLELIKRPLEGSMNAGHSNHANIQLDGGVGMTEIMSPGAEGLLALSGYASDSEPTSGAAS